MRLRSLYRLRDSSPPFICPVVPYTKTLSRSITPLCPFDLGRVEWSWQRCECRVHAVQRLALPLRYALALRDDGLPRGLDRAPIGFFLYGLFAIVPRQRLDLADDICERFPSSPCLAARIESFDNRSRERFRRVSALLGPS
jgi:hypothetical protein